MTRTFSARLLLAAMVSSLAGCATVPPVKAAGPTEFVRQWAGTWNSMAGKGSGEVQLTIDKSLRLIVKTSNSSVPEWDALAEFQDGMLVVKRVTLQMELRLFADGRLRATYSNERNGDYGTWTLSAQD